MMLGKLPRNRLFRKLLSQPIKWTICRLLGHLNDECIGDLALTEKRAIASESSTFGIGYEEPRLPLLVHPMALLNLAATAF
jgi:hypothetical protein